MNLGGKGATCTNCGLIYPMERLREIFHAPTAQEPLHPVPKTPKTPKTKKPAPQEDMIYDVDDWIVLSPPEETKPVFDFVPVQFVMENNSRGHGDLGGRVQQGGIGLGDRVYIDGDYSHPYTIYSINDDPYMICAKEGMPAELFLQHCPKKILKTARMVTGTPNPVANAYNYPGTTAEYFHKVLSCEFSQYTLSRDVSQKELAIPVSFLLHRDGKPVLAVFLIDSNDSKARYQVKKAVRLFASQGIACTHFFENYRNDMPYVIQRINSLLG
jgi:hypothetical protein